MEILICVIIGWVIPYISYAQTVASPFPLTVEQIEFKIDSLRKAYAPYAERKFSTLDEHERKEIMIAKAREAILFFAPDYYREYKEPEIGTDIVKGLKDKSRGQGTIVSQKQEHIGKPIYVISFPYDKSKENIGGVPYIAQFAVFQDTGEPIQLKLGMRSVLLLFDEVSFEEQTKTKFRYPIRYVPYDPHIRIEY